MNGLDLVYEEIKRRVGPEMDQRIEQLAEILLPALNDGTPLEEVPTPPPVGTPAPRTAAARTLLQGAIATALGGAGGVVVEALSDEGFQVFDLGDWAGVGNGALTAAIMAVLAYGMRKIGR